MTMFGVQNIDLKAQSWTLLPCPFSILRNFKRTHSSYTSRSLADFLPTFRAQAAWMSVVIGMENGYGNEVQDWAKYNAS